MTPKTGIVFIELSDVNVYFTLLLTFIANSRIWDIIDPSSVHDNVSSIPHSFSRVCQRDLGRGLSEPMQLCMYYILFGRLYRKTFSFSESFRSSLQLNYVFGSMGMLILLANNPRHRRIFNSLFILYWTWLCCLIVSHVLM